MVYLALTPAGAREAVAMGLRDKVPVWVGSDGLTDAEYNRAGEQGLKISQFIYPLAGADAAVIEGALATVSEHHRGHTVWVEGRIVQSTNR